MNASIEINESSKTIVIDGIDKAAFEKALSESDPQGFALLDSPKVSTSVADRKCLNHGKSWRASGYDVDANGIAPQHEGEMICYVYAK